MITPPKSEAPYNPYITHITPIQPTYNPNMHSQSPFRPPPASLEPPLGRRRAEGSSPRIQGIVALYWDYLGVIWGSYRGYMGVIMGVIWGLYWGLYGDYIGVIL